MGETYTWQVKSHNPAGNGGWSNPMTFTVDTLTHTSAEILALWPVTGAAPGATVNLWARVKNNAAGPLPEDAEVWFYVNYYEPTSLNYWPDGPPPAWLYSPNWVGKISVAALEAGNYVWYKYEWTIPLTMPTGGYYQYNAQVYQGGIEGTYISSYYPTYEFFEMPE